MYMYICIYTHIHTYIKPPYHRIFYHKSHTHTHITIICIKYIYISSLLYIIISFTYSIYKFHVVRNPEVSWLGSRAGQLRNSQTVLSFHHSVQPVTLSCLCPQLVPIPVARGLSRSRHYRHKSKVKWVKRESLLM